MALHVFPQGLHRVRLPAGDVVGCPRDAADREDQSHGAGVALGVLVGFLSQLKRVLNTWKTTSTLRFPSFMPQEACEVVIPKEVDTFSKTLRHTERPHHVFLRVGGRFWQHIDEARDLSSRQSVDHSNGDGFFEAAATSSTHAWKIFVSFFYNKLVV